MRRAVPGRTVVCRPSVSAEALHGAGDHGFRFALADSESGSDATRPVVG